MRGWLHEPLLHFAAIGATIFVAHAWLAPAPAPAEVIVDANVLAAEHHRRTGAPPDDATLDRLIATEVDRALLFREAMALGLGEGDEIVRRRLIQKMNLVLDEAMAVGPPTDDQLRTFVGENADRFAQDERRTLVHVYFRRGPDAKARARRALSALQSGTDHRSVGDPFVVGRRLGPASEARLGTVVDVAFARAAFAADSQDWFGPIESTYGQHVVRVEAIDPGGPATVASVRKAATAAWRRQETARRRDRALELLRDKYTVIVRGPR